MAAPVVELDPAAPVPDRAAAAAYVASICFKHGPPRYVGAELEWLVRSATRPADRLDPAVLLRALGPHAPGTLRSSVPPGPGAAPPPLTPDTPVPLPAGSTVTVEPGGQVEIATPPLEGLAAVVDAVRIDSDAIRSLLAEEDLVLLDRASDPLRPPRRILRVPRYAAMEAAFDRVGPHGRTMMCSTTAVQVCLDAGEGSAVTDRWQALHELGPTLVATFANSPAVHGRRTGWKSSRMASWLALDPERTRPPAVLGPDPAAEWAERALDTSLLCVRRDGTWSAPPAVTFGDWIDGHGGLDIRPTREDLDYHLTTLFPPVRPHGHVEVRYLDQQPGDEWAVPIAVVTALLEDPPTLDRAREAVAPATDRWAAAARHGLEDGVLRRAAGRVVELAHQRLLTTDPALAGLVADVAERRVLRGLCPADTGVGEPGEDELRPAEENPYPDDTTPGEPGGDHA
ncbi:ergothioneine biosynthesis glutamate--cysteine ligase EgtA [Actinomycetospora sp. TBRC 11914]|uniref:ergothioneine biosynthesis glutamate--cysteine ligase EgtA n=1 Tax=Actinomycetospora sp. TBRC 11914 TaxID=2729387 RepID=UPI00145F1F13|nr:ergothioneine biosynthesis glutamate--cysteine ligase EgtA [Actinomycetospora sp. TBRC 11914]NMO89715.1 ergothioneine biosynthesis glutamate--cysteine ligase EgtA [Actinomycetospora sp. TBRC 11914]